jgi:hypothetical protein
VGLFLSRFGKPEENPIVPESYSHQGRWIEVVQLTREITVECFEWLREEYQNCILYSNIVDGVNKGLLRIYNPEKLDAGLAQWRDEGRTSMDIAFPLIAYVKFDGSEKAVEFKLRFADLFAE